MKSLYPTETFLKSLIQETKTFQKILRMRKGSHREQDREFNPPWRCGIILHRRFESIVHGTLKKYLYRTSHEFWAQIFQTKRA